jgi:hypothetical protein
MNPKMVGRAPHPGPLPIGFADSTDAEREKRSLRQDVESRVVQGFNARTQARGILTPALSSFGEEREKSSHASIIRTLPQRTHAGQQSGRQICSHSK